MRLRIMTSCNLENSICNTTHLKYLMQRVSETMVLTLFILLYFLLTQSSWTQLKVRVQVWTQLKGQENEDRSVSGTVGGASGGTIGGVSGSGTDW
ncbi:hypothetical protein AAZX31_17G233900 [Glycine max]|uniref:Uncharacterized protein n=2 Tax=Glycine subgen. Soja TaxID=1462606 RepID=K7MNT1_SOYBN|nr:hypothetical protein JHK85_049284 [Glycine max]RZB58540.1 hypothetical protein D0Y65_046912 [Glycine soja]KAG5098933.1 hypothetical protein JHK82_048787 [Glycine max]KAG5103701.1 hypothetical protein JHK84_048670 [Glycine max]KAH1120005.1 hypothetical protein GYH30_048382 [Glycine max]